MSTSSEVVDSGNKMPDNSTFSHTFNLLSQFFKENRSNFGMAGSLAGITSHLFPATQNSWLPQQDAVSNPQVLNIRRETAQMTIFYGGNLIVQDDFPAEKAMEIMMVAGKAATEGLRLQPAVCHLPIARKASLARFLEKRKERLTARSPYQGQINPSKGDAAKECSGFTAESCSQQS